MTRTPLTVRIPNVPDPAVGVRHSSQPGYVTLEWRYGEVVDRRSLHLDDLRAALARLAPVTGASMTTRSEFDALPVGSGLPLHHAGEHTNGARSSR